MIRLDIFSDIICPWCYIGKTLLDRALEGRAEHPFSIQWHPFQLNPDMPKAGVGHVDYLASRFGGKQRAIQMMLQVTKSAQDAGAEVDMEKCVHLPNTLDAHRLIHWAGIEGKQNQIVTRLFRAHWRDGLNVGDAATLAQIAEDAGMDGAAIARLLATDADLGDIQARDMDARQKGVSSVPTFLIAQQYVVSGAQPVAMWHQVIDEITQKLNSAPQA